MSRAELPDDMGQAADNIERYVASQYDTAVMQLADLEAAFAGPTQVEAAQNKIGAYENMTRIQLLKGLSSLDVNVRIDPELKRYMDETFPDGYEKADPALRLFSWDAYKTKVAESDTSKADAAVIEAMRYQTRQLDDRKIQAAKVIWSEQAVVTMISELEAQTTAAYERDREAAYTENDIREAQRRSEIVRQRAYREIETFLVEAEFVAACEAANYSVSEITAGKPEYAVYTLRTLMNEWEKNGRVEPKPEETASVQTPVALAAVQKALQAQRRRRQTATAALTPVVVEPVPEAIVEPEAAPVQAPPITESVQPTPEATMSAGARAFAELGESPAITAVHLSAMGGRVTGRFVITADPETD